jgi:N-acetylated-alpha-linked acidic dipeptidase
VFPGLDESIDSKDFVNADKWVDIINSCLVSATQTMQ